MSEEIKGRCNNRYVDDVSADGQKLLMLRPLEDAAGAPADGGVELDGVVEKVRMYNALSAKTCLTRR